jgi:hypothetical protein
MWWDGGINILLTFSSFNYCVSRSRDGTVSIATGYRLDDRGRSSSPGKVKNFLFSTSSKPALGQPSLLSKEYWELFPWQ